MQIKNARVQNLSISLYFVILLPTTVLTDRFKGSGLAVIYASFSTSTVPLHLLSCMIPGSKGHAFHACMKKHDFETAKHEKEARVGRISNVFRIAGAQSAEQS